MIERVELKSTHAKHIERAAKRLRPATSAQDGEWWVGTVEKLNGTVDNDGHRSGLVYFSITDPKAKKFRKVQANLEAEFYAVAHEAHGKGNTYIKCRGVLVKDPRHTRFESVSELELL